VQGLTWESRVESGVGSAAPPAPTAEEAAAAAPFAAAAAPDPTVAAIGASWLNPPVL